MQVATQISARNVWPKLAKVAGIGGTCGAEDATKEMERGAILCTNFILLNQQVVRRPRFVWCCSVALHGSLISRIFHAPFLQFYYYYQKCRKNLLKNYGNTIRNFLFEILIKLYEFFNDTCLFVLNKSVKFFKKIYLKEIAKKKRNVPLNLSREMISAKRKYPLRSNVIERSFNSLVGGRFN